MINKDRVSKYYLDLDKINNMPSLEEKEMIHSYYRDMLNYFEEGRDAIANSYFNTLDKGGYIKDRESEDRDKKIDMINE